MEYLPAEQGADGWSGGAGGAGGNGGFISISAGSTGSSTGSLTLGGRIISKGGSGGAGGDGGYGGGGGNGVAGMGEGPFDQAPAGGGWGGDGGDAGKGGGSDGISITQYGSSGINLSFSSASIEVAAGSAGAPGLQGTGGSGGLAAMGSAYPNGDPGSAGSRGADATAPRLSDILILSDGLTAMDSASSIETGEGGELVLRAEERIELASVTGDYVRIDAPTIVSAAGFSGVNVSGEEIRFGNGNALLGAGRAKVGAMGAPITVGGFGGTESVVSAFASSEVWLSSDVDLTIGGIVTHVGSGNSGTISVTTLGKMTTTALIIGEGGNAGIGNYGVGDVGVTLFGGTGISVNASTNPTYSAYLAGIRSTGSGGINIQSSNGDVLIEADVKALGSGSVQIAANGTGKSLSIASGGIVATDTGFVSLRAQYLTIQGLVESQATHASAPGVVLITDRLSLSGADIHSYDAPLAILAHTNSHDIHVVYGLANTPNTLELIVDDLAILESPTLQLGNANLSGGAIAFKTTYDRTLSSLASLPATLALYGSSITQDSGAAIKLDGLMAKAVNGVLLDQGNAMNFLSGGLTGTGDYIVNTSSGTITVGTVAGVGGITTANGGIEINGHAGLLVMAGINAGSSNDNSSVDLTTSSNGATVTISNGVTVSGKDTSGVAIFVRADDLALNGSFNANGSGIAFNPFDSGQNLLIQPTDGVGHFSLSADELTRMSNYSGLYFGHTLGGSSFNSISIQTPVNLGSAHLYMRSNQDVFQNNTSPITASTLEAITVSGVFLDAAVNQISQLKATATAASGSVLFKNSGSFSLASNIVGGTGAAGVSLASVNGSVLNPSDFTITAGTAGMLLTAGDDLGNAAHALRVSSSGQVVISAGANTIDTGDIYLLSTSDLSLGIVAAPAVGSSVNIASVASKHITVGGLFATSDDQVHLVSGGSMTFSGGKVTGSQVTLDAQGGAILSGSASFDVESVSGATLKAQGDIGTGANPLAVKGSTFTFGYVNGGTTQDKMFLELTPNGSSQLMTSQIDVDVTHLTDLYVKAGSGVSEILINDAATQNNPIHATLSMSSGSIRVIQPNAVFSGAGSVTLNAPNTILETITTVENTVNVTGASSIAGTGVLKGSGAWNNAGQTLSVSGILKPGDTTATTGIGNLTVAGNVSLGSGSRLIIDAGSISSYDKLLVGGSLSINSGATVSVAESAVFMALGDQFDVISYVGAGPAALPLAQGLDVNFGVSTTASSNGSLRLSVSSLTNRWKNTSSTTNWADAINWTRGLPTAGHDVVINPTDVGRAVTLTSGAQVARSLVVSGDDSLRVSGGSLSLTSLSSFGSGSTLTVTGGSLNGAANIQISGDFDWSGGTVGGAGTLITATGADTTITGDVTAQRRWNNSGNISLAAVSRLTMDGASLNNLSGGKVDVSSSFATPIQLSGAAAQFNNQGVMNWGTNVNSMVDGQGSFNNQSGGIVNINGTSTLRLNVLAGGLDAGAYNTVAGSKLNNSAGTRTLAAGTTFNGLGTFELSGGQIGILAPSLSIGAGSTLAVSAGVLGSGGRLDIDGVLNWGGGTIGGSGTIATSAGAVSNITGGVVLERNWQNEGAINMTGSGSYLTLKSTLSNEATGVINMNSANNSTVFYLDSASSQLNNAGVINWNSGSGAPNSSIGGIAGSSFNNYGDLNLNGNSSLGISIGGTDSGDYAVSAGSTLKFSSGTRSLQAGSDVNGAGQFVNSGATTTAGGDFSIASSGTLAVTGGVLTLNTSTSPNFNNALVLSGGTLTLNTPDVIFNVPVTVSGATLNGSADFDFAAGSSLALQNATISGAGSLATASGVSSSVTSSSIIGRNWTNDGTINMTGAFSYLTLNGNLSNQASGVLNMNSSYDGPTIYLNSASGQLNNAGQINWNSGAAATTSSVGGTAGSSFNNSGQFNVTGGSTVGLSVPNFSQTGTINIQAGNALVRSTGLVNAGLLKGGGILNVGSGSLSSAGGTIAPGGIGSVATLSIAGNADLTGATLHFDLNQGGSDKLIVNGDLNQAANGVTVAETGGSFVGFGDAFSLVSYGGNLSGTVPTLYHAISDVGFSLASTALSGGALVATVSSVTNRWKETPNDYDWSVGSNWTRGHAPRAGEDAVIAPTTGTRTISIAGGTHEVRSLSLSDDDSLKISAGRLDIIGTSSSASTIASAAALRLDGTGLLRLADAHLSNSGLIELRDDTSLIGVNLGPGAGTLTNEGGARIVKPNGSGTSTIGNFDGGPMVFYNAGTVQSSSGTLEFKGASHWQDGSKFLAGSGSVNLKDTLSLNGSITADTGADVKLGGTVSSGVATLYGAYNWVSGDISGSTTEITVASTGGLNIVGVLAHRLGDGAKLSNEGVIDFQGDGGITSINLGIGGNGILVNASGGRIRKFAGTGTSWLSEDTTEFISFNNQGTLQVGSGTLAVGSGGFLQSGTIALSGGASLKSQSDISNLGWIGGAGTIEIVGAGNVLHNLGTLAPGDTLSGSLAAGLGTLTVVGNLVLGDGSTTLFDMSKSNSDRINVSGDVSYSGSSGPELKLSEFGGASFEGGETRTLIAAGGTLITGAGSATSTGEVTFHVEDDGANLTAQAIGIDNAWALSTPGGADWNTGANWSRGTAPNSYHDVVIDQSGSNVVTLSGQSGQARSIRIGQTQIGNELRLTGGAILDVDNTNVANSQLLQIFGGSKLTLDQSVLAIGNGSMLIHAGADLAGQGFTIAAYSAAAGSATIDNFGTLTSTGMSSVLGQSAAGNSVSLNNAGLLKLSGGDLDVKADNFTQTGTIELAFGSTMSLSSMTLSSLNNQGAILLNGGKLDALAVNLSNSGTVSGAGTLATSIFTNYGTLAPGETASVGTIRVEGDFINDAGLIKIRAASPSSYDKLDVSGNANFSNGELAFSIYPASGHAFAAGQVYQPISALLGEGSFTTISGLSPYVQTVDYSSGMNVTLSNPAGSIVWVGTDGDWSNKANWNLNRLPGLGDTVIINPALPRTITISSGTGFTGFDFSGSDDTVLIIGEGSLNLPGSSTLNGLLHVNGGSLINSGTNTASAIQVSSGNLINNSQLTVNTLGLSGGSLSIASGQRLNVTTLGYWNGAAQLQGPGTLGIASSANFNVSGSGNRILDGLTLHNQGILSLGLSSGRLEVNNSSHLLSDAGGEIRSTGSSQLVTTTTGAGTLTLDGGQLEAGAGSILKIASNSLSVKGSASFNGSAPIELSAGQASYEDAISVSGLVYMAAGNHTLSSGASLQGSGTVAVTDAGSNVTVEDVEVQSAVSLYVDQGSFTVANSKTLTVASGGYVALSRSVAGIGGTIRNQGTVATSDPGSLQTIAPNFVNEGYLSVGASTSALEFTGALTLAASGTVDLQNGATIKRAAGMINQGLITSQGNATLDVGAGGYSGSGTLSPGGSASSATLSIAGNADLTGAKLQISLQNAASYDKISVSGNLTVSSSMQVGLSEQGSPFVGSGDAFTVISAGGTVTGLPSTSVTSYVSDVDFSSSLSGKNVVAAVSSTTNRWTSDANASWSSSNWSRGHVPRSGEDVVIDRAGGNPVVEIGSGVTAEAKSIELKSMDQLHIKGAGTLTLGTGGMSVDTGSVLQIESGALKINGDVNVQGLLGWGGGSIEALTPSSAINIHSGGNLSVSTVSGVTLGSGAVLVVYGDAYWNAGQVTIDGDVLIDPAGKFQVDLSAAPASLVGNGTMTVLGGGELAVTGSKALSVGLKLENWGQLNVSNGAQIDLQTGGIHSDGVSNGSFDIAAGGHLVFSGNNQTHDLSAAAVTGAGKVSIAGSGTTQVIAGSAYSATSTAVQSGELVLDGANVAQVSVMGGRLKLDQTGTAATSVGNLTLSSGTVSVLADAAIGNSPFSGGTLHIDSGATLSSTGNLTLSGSIAGTGGGVLHNTGTILGAGTLGVGTGLLKNSGTIAPGGAEVATISIAGNADLTGGRVEIGLDNTSQYDQLAILGDLVSGGSIVLSDLSGTLASGNTFQPITYSGAQSGAAIALDSSSISSLSFTLTPGAPSNSAYTLTAGAPSAIFWDGGGFDGLWSNPVNWSTDLLPVAGQNVTISPAGSGSVTIAAGTNISGLFGLSLDATDALFITGGSLALPGSSNLSLNGAVNLQGGTIIGHATGGDFAGGLNWASGTMAGTGSYSASSLSLSGGGARTLSMSGGSLNPSAFTTTLQDGKLSLLAGQLSAGIGMVVAPSATLSFDGGQLGASTFRNQGRTNINIGSVSLPTSTTSQTGEFVIANGATLSFSNNATLAASASVTGGMWSIASGKTVTALGSLNRGSGSVTEVNGQLNVNGNFETDQLTLLGGASLTGSTGLFKVNTAFDDSLATSPITGFGTATITQASGNLEFNQDLSVTGALKLNASGGSIETAPAVSLSGATLVASASGGIDVQVQASTVSAGSSGGDITLDLASSTVFGSLSTASGHVTRINAANKNVGQSGVINTAGRVDLDLDGGSVSWLDSNNVFGQGIHLSQVNLARVQFSTSAFMSLSGNAAAIELLGGAIGLGNTLDTLDVSGPLTVVASGNISQGAALNIAGLTDLATSAGSGASILMTVPSTYTGGVKFNSAMDATFLSSGAGALNLRGSAVGSLTVSAAAGITQSSGTGGQLQIGGAAEFTSVGQPVELLHTSNNFNAVKLMAGSVSLAESNGMNVEGSLSGAANFYTGGALGSSGLLSASSLTVENIGGSAIAVSLHQANIGAGGTAFENGSSGYSSITYSNSGAGMINSPVDVSGAFNYTQAGAAVLPQITADSVQINATGAVSQSGPITAVRSSFSSPGFNVNLGGNPNDLQQLSITGAQVNVWSTNVVDPHIQATGAVSLQVAEVIQSAARGIQAPSLGVSAAGAVDLLGNNSIAALSVAAGQGIDVRNNSASLVLQGVSAGATEGARISNTGVISQGSGAVSAAQVMLEASAVGAVAQPVQINSPVVQIVASLGDVVVSNDQASTLGASSAAGSFEYRSNGQAISVQDSLLAGDRLVLDAGISANLTFGGSQAAPMVVSAENGISLNGKDVSIVGGSSAGATTQLNGLAGGIQATAAGNFVIRGASVEGNASASVLSDGPVNIYVAGTLSIVGGGGAGSYALLDPLTNQPMNIQASAVNITGGAGNGAYAAILSQGSIAINANSLSLLAGTGQDADAVVISQFGLITAPSNCNGCMQLSINPMSDGNRSTGLWQGGRVVEAEPAVNPVLVSTPLSQIDATVEDLVSQPDNPEDLERERKKETEAPPDGLTCS